MLKFKVGRDNIKGLKLFVNFLPTNLKLRNIVNMSGQEVQTVVAQGGGRGKTAIILAWLLDISFLYNFTLKVCSFY